MMTEQKQERFVYIYNPVQSNFYLSQGITLKETGIHPSTKRVWYKFSYDDTLDVYSEWCTRNK